MQEDEKMYNVSTDRAMDPDNLPLPEDETVEYLPDITPEMVLDEMVKVNEDGYAPCAMLVSLCKLEKLDPEEYALLHQDDDDGPNDTMCEIEDLPEDEAVEIETLPFEGCKLFPYTLDGETVNLELIFDTSIDAEMEDILDILDRYRDMCMAFDKAEPGTEDFPVLRFLFSPLRYPGQGIACYAQPIAYFKTCQRNSSEPNVIHLLFPVDRTGVHCFRLKKQDAEEQMEYVQSRIRSGFYY